MRYSRKAQPRQPGASNHISVNNPQSLVCLTVGGFLIEMRDKMNELTKRIVSAYCAADDDRTRVLFRHFGMAVFTGDAPDEH